MVGRIVIESNENETQAIIARLWDNKNNWRFMFARNSVQQPISFVLFHDFGYQFKKARFKFPIVKGILGYF